MTTTNWASEARIYKPLMRDYMLRTERPYRTALFLPGWDDEADTGCLCVSRGLEIGAITTDTKIIAVERKYAWSEKIADKLESMGFSQVPLVLCGELADVDFSDYPLIDFAMIDLLGTIDLPLAWWIERSLMPALTPGATVAFTLTRFPRNNAFMTGIEYAWRQSRRLLMIIRRYGREVGVEGQELVHHAVIKSCLHQYVSTYRRVQTYRDSRRTMITCRFDNIRAGMSQWPSTDEVLAELDRIYDAHDMKAG